MQTTIKVKIAVETAALVQQYVATARHVDGSGLTLEELAIMMLEDVALYVRRPGCWEAYAIGNLLAAHGYKERVL